MKKIFIAMLMVTIFFLSLIVTSNAQGRVIYQISQISKNNIKISLLSDDKQKIRITAYKKYNDDTISVSYILGDEIEKKDITVNLSDLKLDMTNIRFPNVILVCDKTASMGIFKDLQQSGEVKSAVENLYNNGVIAGYEDGTFKPDAKISREEFCTIFSKLLPQSDDININIFSDVEQTRWSKKYINLLTFKGIIKGKEKGIFKPTDDITLAEVMTIIDRAYNMVNVKTANGYRHLKVQHWANQSVSDMLDDRILKTEDVFYDGNIDRKMTRGECAIVLNRLFRSYKELRNK